MAHVLLIDDDRADLRAVARLVLVAGHEVEVAETAEAVDAHLESGVYEVIFCDLHFGPRSGRDMYERASPEIARRFVFMTSGEISVDDKAFLDGQRHIAKPPTMAMVLVALAGTSGAR